MSSIWKGSKDTPADPKWSIPVWKARCTVANPPGTPKPRSACQPFSYELYATSDLATTRLQGKIVERLHRLLLKEQKSRRPPKGVVAVWQPSLESWRQAA